MKKFIKPNWKKSNLNISATLAEFLGAPNQNATLPKLKKELQKGYKNVVFMCFDGLGIYPLKQNLKKDDYLIKHITQKLTSTFPSTTTNATTSLLNNMYPIQHGYCGWSMNIDELNKNVDIYLNQDSWTKESVNIKNSPFAQLDYYFDNSNSSYKINTIFPSYVKVKKQKNNNVFEDENGFFNAIKNICNKKGNQFVYAYYPEPDHSMHEYGVTSKIAKNIITSISNNVKKLVTETSNTVFIITADHGQIDINGYVELYKDKKLYQMLKIYPYLDSRAVAFKVKDGKKDEFKKYFNSKYKKDFKLFETKKLINSGIFGYNGNKAHLLGDYIAIGTNTNKIALITPNSQRFKGHHTSLTYEMLVPLIIVNN